jgi:endoglucanase
MHRPDCNAISETPQVSNYTLKQWKNDLIFMAKRYKNISNVI